MKAERRLTAFAHWLKMSGCAVLLLACGDQTLSTGGSGGSGGAGGGESTAGTGGQAGSGVDRCAQNKCHPEATCTPKPDAEDGEPKYACSCNDGWEGNGFGCEDANECVDDTHACTESQVCVNEQGGYRCECSLGAVDFDNDGMCEWRFADLSVADETTCAVAEDHTMWCWGHASQAGNSISYGGPHLWPVQAGSSTHWKLGVRMGSNHGCGVKDYGALWCWGANDKGQLGIGTTKSQVLPGSGDIELDWQTVSAGHAHSCGIQLDGSLWCWGANGKGQLGIGTTDSTPVPNYLRVGTDQTWKHVEAGADSTCGIKTDGSLWCWGSNDKGQLGDGTSIGHSASPKKVGMKTNWASVHVSNTPCGIDSSGALFCWGANNRGQVGDGTLEKKVSPTAVAANETFQYVGGGSEHNCAVRKDGSLWCWGRNDTGQLGLTEPTDRSVPFQVGQSSQWRLADGGARHSCGLKTDGSLSCWGANDTGQLGRGTRSVPVYPLSTTLEWKAISGAVSHSCGIKTDGSLWCSGANAYGALGTGTTTPSQDYVQVGGKSWTKVDCGSQSTCAIGADDTLWCWGYGGYRQLGLGSNSSYQTPQEVGGSWKHISIGSFFSCGIKTDGTLWCWGFNSKGQCGPTALGLYLTTPTQVGSASDWTSVKTGYRHSCAHKTDGTLWCWGDGAVGQLGHGNQTQQLLPKEVSALSVVVDYGLGDWHSCARTPNGQVWCWGSNSELQLGKGDKDSEQAPYEVTLDGSTTAALSVSARHSCALSTNGTLRCWGRNSHGQMGQGMTGNPTIPVVVGKPMAWTGVNAFGNSTTATGMDGKHYVWGDNGVGQLGTGDAWLLPGAVRPPDEPAMEVTP